MSDERIRDLRAELAALRARHDSGAVPAATYDVVRQLEIDIAWHEHRAAAMESLGHAERRELAP